MYTFYESIRSKEFGRTSTNMYLQYKWDTENFANHRYKVKTAKPCIDNSAPLTFTHMFIRPKKLQLELERYSTIQRHNRFLLERLATIQREGAWIDNKNFRQPRSLNTWKRQQEMIELAHNNQIMIARLQDVNAQHNKTKLEDEYLLNQKYKANIQKWPPNWREVQKHLDRVKANIFKKVFDSKYATKAYRKSRKQALQKWALEKEKFAAAKAEKDAQVASEAEKREQIAKEERKQAAKEQKKALEKRLKSSEKWRIAREERLKLAEKTKHSKDEEIERKKREIQEKEIKRRKKLKRELQEWKQKQKEEKKKQLEEDKKREGKLKKEKLKEERKGHRKDEIKQDIEDEQIETKREYSIESIESDFETNHREDKYEEEKPSILDGETKGLEEEITATDSIIVKSDTDETLSSEQLTSDRQAIMDEEIKAIIDEQIKKITSGEEVQETKTIFDEDQQRHKTVSEHEDSTVETPTSEKETVTEEQGSSDDETPRAEQTISSQDLNKGTSNEEISGSVTPESNDVESITDDVESIPDDIETISDDESFETEENTSDDEFVATDKTSDQQSP